LIPMLCKAGGITKRDIGTIRIENRETHVELNAAVVERFFTHLGEGARLEKNIVAMPMRESGAREERSHREQPRQRRDVRPQREKWSPERADRQERPAAARPGRKERERQKSAQLGKPPASAHPAAGKPNKKKKKKWTPVDLGQHQRPERVPSSSSVLPTRTSDSNPSTPSAMMSSNTSTVPPAMRRPVANM